MSRLTDPEGLTLYSPDGSVWIRHRQLSLDYVQVVCMGDIPNRIVTQEQAASERAEYRRLGWGARRVPAPRGARSET